MKWPGNNNSGYPILGANIGVRMGLTREENVRILNELSP